MKPMLGRVFRLIKIGAVVGAIVGAIRMLLGRRQAPVTGEASWPTLAERAAATRAQQTEPAASRSAGQPAEEPADPDEQAEQADDEPAESAAGEDWVEPVDGACPATHPVKGKPGTGIFHMPGGLFYDRTVPDRCYRSAEAAEADGLRPAKR